METEIDRQVEELRHRCDVALQRRLSDPKNLSPATLIRILSPVIEKYLAAGLVLEEVAKALREEGFPITKGHLVRHLGAIRAESGLPPLKRGRKPAQDASEASSAPAAPEGREQEKAPAAPAPAQSPAAVLVSVPQAVTPASAAGAPAVAIAASALSVKPGAAAASAPRAAPKKPRWMRDEDWAMKPRIDRLMHEIPAADREYPELMDARHWIDKGGQRWDVCGDAAPEDGAERNAFEMARSRYQIARRALFEAWGIAKGISHSNLKPRYALATDQRQPFTIDLNKLISGHLD